MVDPFDLEYLDNKYENLGIHEFFDKYGEEIWNGKIRDDDIIKYLFENLRADAESDYICVYTHLRSLYKYLINIKYNEKKYRNTIARKLLFNVYTELELYIGDLYSGKGRYFRDKFTIEKQKEIYKEALESCICIWDYDNIEECDKKLPEQFYISNMFPDYDKDKFQKEWLYNFCDKYIKEDYD